MLNAGDIVVTDFPGATGIKRRPAVVLSSSTYHAARPDVILGVITSQVGSATGPTDYALQDWSSAGLRVPSAFRTFLATLHEGAVSARIGKLSQADWQGVVVCVRASLGT